MLSHIAWNNNGNTYIAVVLETSAGPRPERATHEEQCAVEKGGRRARGKMFGWKKLKVL